jgi:hypothetical protein
MDEHLEAIVLINLEGESGWKRMQPPVHIPVMPQFLISETDIDTASRALQAAVFDQAPLTVGYETVQFEAVDVTRVVETPALLGLHLAMFKAVRPLIANWGHFDMLQHSVGDAYAPRIANDTMNVFRDGEITVDELAFAVKKRTPKSEKPIWVRQQPLLKLKGLSDDQITS